MNETQLRLLKVGHVVEAARSLVETATLRWWPDMLLDTLNYELSVKVLADQLAEDQTVVFREYPATWWQHTKLVAFPTFSKWLKRQPRMERETQVVTVTTYATFPESKIYPQNLGSPRLVQTVITKTDAKDDDA